MKTTHQNQLTSYINQATGRALAKWWATMVDNQGGHTVIEMAKSIQPYKMNGFDHRFEVEVTIAVRPVLDEALTEEHNREIAEFDSFKP